MILQKPFIYLLSITIILLGISCSTTSEKSNDEINKIDTLSKNKKDIQAIAYNFDTLSINDVTFNNQKVFLSNTEFKQYFKVDSSKTDIWDCGDPFTYLDKEWMEKTYGKYDPNKGTYTNFDGKITTFFVGNTQFSSNNNKVLFVESKAKGNKFAIGNNNITLDENITTEDFKKIFPNAAIGPLEEPGVEGVRIPVDRNGADAWVFTFKNHKLYSYILFWDLC